MNGPQSTDDYAPLSDINITPFVDVMLVLLVIFMVTAPFLESGIPVNIPKATGKALNKGASPITLSITKNRDFFLDDRPLQGVDLMDVIRQAFKGKQDQGIFIRADGELPYAFVAQTMAAIKAAGVSKIGLVTLAPEQSTPRKKVSRKK